MAYPGPSVIPQWISTPATGITPAGPSAPYLRQTDANGYTRFQSPSTIGSGKSAVSGRMVVNIPRNNANNSQLTVWNIGNNAALLTRQNDSNGGEITFRAGNNFGDWHVNISLPPGTMPLDVPVLFEFGAKLAAAASDREGWVRINGTLHTQEDLATYTGTTAAFGSGHRLEHLNTGIPGAFGNMDHWWSYNALGVLPTGAPDVVIGPDLAGVNAHPHRIGAPAVAA